MNKADMIQLVREKNNLTNAKATEVVNTLLDAMQEALLNGEEVRLQGVGTIEVRARRARYARKPATGEQIWVPQRRTIGLKASSTIKKLLNE